MPKFRDSEQLSNLFLMLKSREDDMKILLLQVTSSESWARGSWIWAKPYRFVQAGNYCWKAGAE
jgi:hypothetical protein